ncbi:hypothetical protein EMIHUDRAFT_215788 [Emiliania huxleyi CCMP1516]|uniref:Lipid-binding serum glycoprotein N-terminal domain-containing protein n=2 Tax=Emiliania huxleyi TaxID=2903 RepID=A0A0D3IGY3_EMIH1|nr:hypothetical protein EMIHUDRAFT_215788 [Emiliania huxleyi CCMP1516]EOD10518.1 hypothetical protein EMIHUDRAFT_215788 [Emiliania huxleyi CCMP1516]|eukprot:XP_005762947.1 hypothetical protein EMIHUDRAFT_215788 [Emiliania huxleyi CCMP1516]
MIATAADTRPRRIAALSLAAIALTCFAAVYHAGVLPQPDEFGRQKDAATFQGEESCKSRSGPIHSFINSAVDKVVARVPGSKISDLPVEANINVGPVKVTISELKIEALSVESVDYDSCGGLRNGLKVHLTGIDLGVGLHYDEPGKWGRGAASGDARTAVTGTIDLTISELSEVTERASAPPTSRSFRFRSADPRFGPLGCETKRGGRMAHVEISGAEGSKLEGKGGSFEGLVAMLNSALAALQDKKPKILG